MSENKREARKPQVAVGQVWVMGADEFVVTRVGVDDPPWDVELLARDGSRDLARSSGMVEFPLWSCVGVDTPAGRVMVGERRQDPHEGPSEVVRVEDGHHIFVTCDVDGHTYAAVEVASWPLLPALAPDHAPHLPSADPLCAPIPDAAGIVSRAVAEWMEKHREGEAREVRRREIDAVLAEDARRFPAFATARRSWMLAVYEKHERGGLGSSSEVATWAAGTLMIAHQYESERGGARTPRPEALAIHLDRNGNRRAGVAAYERARSLP